MVTLQEIIPNKKHKLHKSSTESTIDSTSTSTSTASSSSASSSASSCSSPCSKSPQSPKPTSRSQLIQQPRQVPEFSCETHTPSTIFLNVYDVLSPSDPNTIPKMNDFLLHCGIGIFHTGIQVWNREFAFGGHSEAESGIFEVPPRQCPSVRYRTTLCLGRTTLSERHVDQLIHALGLTEYLGYKYSLITRNCNTFSCHLATLLGVEPKRFPCWVNRLAGLALNIKCLLPEPLLTPLSDGLPDGCVDPLLDEPQKPPRVATLQ